MSCSSSVADSLLAMVPLLGVECPGLWPVSLRAGPGCVLNVFVSALHFWVARLPHQVQVQWPCQASVMGS